MAFVFSKTTPLTGPIAMYEFKTLLKAQGWTVPRSSDGTTYNAAADIIVSGAAGAGGLANANAWFILRDPAGVAEISVQRMTNTVWRIKWSRSARFTGGSPGATQTPSAADEYIVFGAGTDAAPSGGSILSTDGLYRWYGAADSAAPYGWWFGAWLSAAGTPATAFVYDPVVPANNTDSNQYIFYLSGAAGGGQVFTATTSNGLQSESPSPTINMTAGYVPNAGSGAATIFQAATLNTATIVVPALLGGNPISGLDEVFPMYWMRRGALATPGLKGYSTLMKWHGTTRSTGDTLSITTSRDRIVIKDVNLPWDGTTPTV